MLAGLCKANDPVDDNLRHRASVSHFSKSASQTLLKAARIASMCAGSIWCFEKGIGGPLWCRPGARFNTCRRTVCAILHMVPLQPGFPVIHHSKEPRE
jgi:hypothetical protein